MEYSDENMCGSTAVLWLDGDNEKIREKFQQLQIELGSNHELMWSIYDDVMKQSEHTLLQWTTIMNIVLAMLLMVAGVGLLNSAKGMLLARKKEYQILRMLGATKRRVHRVCMVQVFSYMISGVVLGAVFGIIVVAYLWKDNVITNTSITINWEYIAGSVVYLFLLSLLLDVMIDK